MWIWIYYYNKSCFCYQGDCLVCIYFSAVICWHIVQSLCNFNTSIIMYDDEISSPESDFSFRAYMEKNMYPGKANESDSHHARMVKNKNHLPQYLQKATFLQHKCSLPVSEPSYYVCMVKIICTIGKCLCWSCCFYSHSLSFIDLWLLMLELQYDVLVKVTYYFLCLTVAIKNVLCDVLCFVLSFIHNVFLTWLPLSVATISMINLFNHKKTFSIFHSLSFGE